jgi:hypothetical protein
MQSEESKGRSAINQKKSIGRSAMQSKTHKKNHQKKKQPIRIKPNKTKTKPNQQIVSALS